MTCAGTGEFQHGPHIYAGYSHVFLGHWQLSFGTDFVTNKTCPEFAQREGDERFHPATPSVVFSTLPEVCCVLHVACCTSLHAASRVACRCFRYICPLHGACCLDVVCCTRVVRWSGTFSPLHIACRLLHFPRCMLRVVDGLLHIFQWSSAALLSVGSCLRVLSLLHVARSPLQVV